jgi:hypothetical protein
VRTGVTRQPGDPFPKSYWAPIPRLCVLEGMERRLPLSTCSRQLSCEEAGAE